MTENQMEVHHRNAEPWRVTLVDTGHATLTGGRLRRVRSYLGNETFCFTYGDGVSDLDLGKLLAFHRSHGRLATLTAIQPPGRYGAVLIERTRVTSFQEKPDGDGAWINGGFFVLETGALDYIDGDQTSWESTPLERMARDDELRAYQHSGFWQAMDTLRDKNQLEELWQSGRAPWKCWG
jgi:glucose-1-phosphate cytidylyltransferase